MNKPISYPLAKLVIEKGFDKECNNYYNMVNHSGKYQLDTRIWENSDDYIDAPTISDVCMWCFNKYDIWIVVFPTEENWTFDIFNKIECVKSESFIKSPTEAYEAAIEYTLTKLI